MDIITCEKVTIGYIKTPVVSDVSFSLKQGDYMCIVGENGSGKSTLMKGILGLIKLFKGKINFNGIKPNEIGYLPQQTIVQKDFPASVGEVVLSGCLNRSSMLPFYTKKDKERALLNLKYLNIESLRKKSYRDLSGGQQQRVLLGRALCSADKVLLLDEPVAGLDPVIAGELYQIINKLNEQGMTIIMISHDIDSAVKYGNKILHMQGKALFYGSKDDYVLTPIYQQMSGGGQNV